MIASYGSLPHTDIYRDGTTLCLFDLSAKELEGASESDTEGKNNSGSEIV
jgi:hypothetical protein